MLSKEIEEYIKEHQYDGFMSSGGKRVPISPPLQHWLDKARQLEKEGQWTDSILDDMGKLEDERNFWRNQAEIAWKAYDMEGWAKIEKMLDSLGYDKSSYPKDE